MKSKKRGNSRPEFLLNEKILNSKRSLSPVIATVLLIMIVIVLASIIILWARGFIKENVLKFEKPADIVCSDVSIKTFVNDDNSFGFTNTGNVPIYAVDLKVSEGWESNIYKIEEKVESGFSLVLEGHTYDSNKEFKIIPILLGKTDSGESKEYTCPENTGFVV